MVVCLGFNNNNGLWPNLPHKMGFASEAVGVSSSGGLL